MTGRVLMLVAVALWWAGLPSTGSSSALSRAVGEVAGVSLVLVAAWVGAAWVLGLLGRLPGRAGWAARRLLGLLLPRAARVVLVGSLGMQAVAPPAVAAGAPPAVAAGAPPAVAAETATIAVERPLTSLSTVAASTSAGSGRRPRAVMPAPTTVVVAPGDSLWSIAERHGEPGAAAADVAVAWPRWYAANRHVIGPDPGLLQVGTVLRVPSSVQRQG
jgi:resuscitation-promoting factor RpfA